MVVLLLVGILASFAVLSMPTPDIRTRVEREAHRLRALLDVAMNEAILRDSPVGLIVRVKSYGFAVLDDDGHWRALKDSVLRDRSIPSGLRLLLHTDGVPEGLVSSSLSAVSPPVLFYSSGELTPFDLQVTDEAGAAHADISATESGRITLNDESPQ